MKHTLLSVIASLSLLVTLLPPSSADAVAPASAAAVVQEGAFKASIDRQRALRVEGTDAAEMMILEVTDNPATITIEYRRTDGAGTPQRASFLLSAFNRLIVNARGGDDFVNIIDAAGLLDAQKKVLNLDGGDGNNIVVVSYLPFKPETATRVMRLLDLSRQFEDIARRAAEATRQALAGDALRLIDSIRVNLADPLKSLSADAERQLIAPAREMVERTGPQLVELGNAFATRRDNLDKQLNDFVAELTSKYGPPSGGYPPDEREPAVTPPDQPGTDTQREQEVNAVRQRAEQLEQAGLALGEEARAQIGQRRNQIENTAAGIERQATEFERRAEALGARAETLAAQSEQDLTAATDRVLAAVAELKLMGGNFQEAAMALMDEIRRSASMRPAPKTPPPPKPSPKPKRAKAAPKTPAAKGTPAQPQATSCSTPAATIHLYTGGPQSDFVWAFGSVQGWTILGNGGPDFLFGSKAADNIYGGPGNDLICGMTDDDRIQGGDGTDLLFGEWLVDDPSITGNDYICGDKGVDLVVGDNLIDTPSGTPGGDDYQLSGGDDTDFVIGDDVLEAPNYPNLSGLSLEIFSQTHPGGADHIEGNDGIDILFGDGGDDPQIDGNDGIDFAEGNGGNDVIDGGGGQNFSFCNTTVEVGNLLLGGRGDDTITGGAGIDVIFGNEDMDTLTGKDQVDFMFGNDGRDTMYGDAGGTICVINNIPIRLGNLMLGGPEKDQMWAGGDLDVMLGNDNDDRIYGYDGSPQQPFAFDIDVLLGGPGDDYMEGDNEALNLLASIDFMDGGPGDDEMHGGKDIDFMRGESGQDRMYGDSNAFPLASSIDLMWGGPDNDYMDGGNGLDLMFGEDGNDTMFGDDETSGLISPDLMFGGDGDDTMNGGYSFDFMFGEAGADHMLGDSNLFFELLSYDFMFGGTGADYMDGGNGADYMFGGPDCDTMLGDNSQPGRISLDFMLGEGGDDKMDGGDSPDFMWGGDGNDEMFGDHEYWWQIASSDLMLGDDGCDTMYGGRGLDLMWGGKGVDHIDGQRGPDVISGGDQSDVINGGELLDFIWGGDGNDLIHGDDFPDFIWGGNGNDCLYGDDGQDFIRGGDGDDCIKGGSHTDFLFGDNGDDKLDGGGGFDFIFGGSGQDEGWRGPGGAVFFSVETKHRGSGPDCDCDIEVCTGSLCVHKFNDLNGDGIQNNGEPNLQGWAFQVTGSCVGAVLVSDANGNACGDFFPGTYTVTEQVQGGWTPTTPTTQTATVATAQTANLNFGNRGPGMLCVHKFLDVNNNGVQDFNESGLPNWSFTVTGSSGASLTLTTQANGTACQPLPAGAYTVAEQPQNGYADTTPPALTVTVANATTTATFGNRRLGNMGRLCVYKFEDKNGNGIQDAGELGVAGVVFTAPVAGGLVTLTTDQNGRACRDLLPGTYTVTEQVPSGWLATTPTTQAVVVTVGQTTYVTFGNRH